MIRVGICDDDALAVRYLAHAVDDEQGMGVVVRCHDGAEAVAATETVHVWLMDIRMPRMSGVEACRVLTSRPNPPKVVMLTSFSDVQLRDAQRAGASGYLFKDLPLQTLAAAIRAVHAGVVVNSPEVLDGALNRSLQAEPPPPGVVQDQTDLRLLQGVRVGESYDEIAVALGMSVSGVKKRMAALLKRSDSRSRPELTAKAIGWLL